MLNKKLLAVAIVGTLAAGNATAANLSAPGGPQASYFAKEIVTTGAAPGTLLMTSASPATRLNWDVGYNFSHNEVRYARVDCSSNLRFGANTGVSLAGGASSIGAINGVATNVITFSVTSTAAANLIEEDDVLTVTGDHGVTSTENVSCTVGLYDQPSQAQAGGNDGLIGGSVASGNYLAFADSYELVATPTTNTADVEAAPTFSRFVGNASTATFSNGVFHYRLKQPAGWQATTFGTNGAAITLGALLAGTTSLEVAGDFSIAANATTPSFNAGALGRVQLNGGNASALTASKATYNVGNAGFTNGNFSLTTLTGAGGNRAIPEAEYTATLKAVAANPTVYTVTDKTANLGRIVRNGTQLQAPLVQVPGGWISRLVLTNTSSIARPYTISVISETGNTVTTDNLTGTIPANGTYVVEDLNTVLTGFTGPNKRATLNVSVAGPNTAIQGLYQIVNPDKGSISNHVLVRPGTN